MNKNKSAENIISDQNKKDKDLPIESTRQGIADIFSPSENTQEGIPGVINASEIEKLSSSSDDSFPDSLDDFSRFSFGQIYKSKGQGLRDNEEEMPKQYENLTQEVESETNDTLKAVKAKVQRLSDVLDEKCVTDQELFKVMEEEKEFLSEQMRSVETKSKLLEDNLATLSATVTKEVENIIQIEKHLLKKSQSLSKSMVDNVISRKSFIKYRNSFIEFISKRFMASSTEIFSFFLQVFNKSLKRQRDFFNSNVNNTQNLVGPQRVGIVNYVMDEYGNTISTSQSIINWLNLETDNKKCGLPAIPKLSDLVLTMISSIIVDDLTISFGKLLENSELSAKPNHTLYLKVFPNVLRIEDTIHRIMKLGEECKNLENYGKDIPEVQKKFEKIISGTKKKEILMRKLEEMIKLLEGEIGDLSSRILQIECELGHNIRQKFSELEDTLWPEIQNLKIRIEKLEKVTDVYDTIADAEKVSKLGESISKCISRLKIIEVIVGEMKERVKLLTTNQSEFKSYITEKSIPLSNKALEMLQNLAEDKILSLIEAVLTSASNVQDNVKTLQEKLTHMDSKLINTSASYETSGKQFIESTLEKLKLIEQRMDIMDIACQKAGERLRNPKSEVNFSISDISYQKQLNKSNYLLNSTKEDPGHSILSEELKNCKDKFERDLASLQEELGRLTVKIQGASLVDKETSTMDLLKKSSVIENKSLTPEKTVPREKRFAHSPKIGKVGSPKKEKFGETSKKILKTTVSRDPSVERSVSKSGDMEHSEFSHKEKDFILDKEKCHQIVFSDQGKVNVYVYGDVRNLMKEIVLTVHDVGKNHSSFHPIFLQPSIDHMLDKITLVQVEFPGHDLKSPMLFPNKFPKSLEHFAEILVIVLINLGITSALGMGEGAGANVLLRLALLVPDRISGLFLINANGGTSGLQESLQNKWSKWASSPITWSKMGLKSLYCHWYGKKGDNMEQIKVDVSKMLLSGMNIQNMKRYYDLFVARTNLLQRIPRNLACRTMYITESSSLHFSQSKQLFSNSDVLKAQLVEINCTGNVLQEAVDEIGRYFVKFSHLLDNLLDVGIPQSRRAVSITETIGLQISH